MIKVFILLSEEHFSPERLILNWYFILVDQSI